MRSHPIKLAGVDLPERFDLEILQVIAFENIIRVLLVLFLQLQIVEQGEKKLIDLVEAHLFFLISSLSDRTIDKSYTFSGVTSRSTLRDLRWKAIIFSCRLRGIVPSTDITRTQAL